MDICPSPERSVTLLSPYRMKCLEELAKYNLDAPSEVSALFYKGCHSIDLNDILLPPNVTSKCSESYSSDENYSQKCNSLLTSLNANLENLKNLCFETTMVKSELEKICGNDGRNKKKKTAQDVIQGLKTLYQEKEQKRFRRSNQYLQKNLECPFENCNKVYASRSSLKLHMKINHQLNDPKKPESKFNLGKVLYRCCRHDLDIDPSTVIKNAPISSIGSMSTGNSSPIKTKNIEVVVNEHYLTANSVDDSNESIMLKKRSFEAVAPQNETQSHKENVYEVHSDTNTQKVQPKVESAKKIRRKGRAKKPVKRSMNDIMKHKKLFSTLQNGTVVSRMQSFD